MHRLSRPRPEDPSRRTRTGHVAERRDGRRHGLEVFAVEDTAVQLTWSSLGEGLVQVRAGDQVRSFRSDGRPGALVVDGLEPSRPVDVRVSGADLHGTQLLRTRTLATPPGAELHRIATLSDLHVGVRSFGFRGTIVERPWPDDLHTVRCARAAIAEALDWGADLLVLKGDITNDGFPRQWDQVASLLDGLPVPVLLIAGNHDCAPNRLIEPEHAAAERGLTLHRGVQVHDLPGIRLVLGETNRPGVTRGRVAHRTDAIVDAVGGADGPALVLLHHFLRHGLRPPLPPRSVPALESHGFVRALARANPDTFVSSGHSHRNRLDRFGPVTVTQVGSPKDFPGVWGGYVVHEGGIRQVVQRVADPDCRVWLDRSRAAALGLWGHLAPGRLADRCTSVSWTRRSASGAR